MKTLLTHLTRFAAFTASQKTRAHKKLRKMKTEARPNAYDILAAVEKSDPGTFDDFCSEFGYNTDSRAAVRTYFAVQKEYADLARIFTAEQPWLINVKLRMYTRSFMIMVMAMALKSLPSAAQCGKPKPTAKLTLKMNTSAP